MAFISWKCVKKSNSLKVSEEILFKNLDQSLKKWTIPHIFPSKIYNLPTISDSTSYLIKIVEKLQEVDSQTKIIKLFTTDVIYDLQKYYKYLHIGIIHVVIKPLTRGGLNTSVLACLRDKRHLSFNDSLLGIVESSLCTGPIYFDCFLNYSIKIPISLSL